MLSWICPECGRENDPAFQECPFCTPGLLKPPPVQQRRARRRDIAQPPPVSVSFETDYATAPFIDVASLQLPSPPLSGVQYRAEHPLSPPVETPDFATAPFIDLESLRLPPTAACMPSALAPDVEWAPPGQVVASAPPIAPTVIESMPPRPSPLARSVEWADRSNKAPSECMPSALGPDVEWSPPGRAVPSATAVIESAAPPILPAEFSQPIDVLPPPSPDPVALTPIVEWAPRAKMDIPSPRVTADPQVEWAPLPADPPYLRLPTAAMCMPSALTADFESPTIEVNYSVVAPPEALPVALAPSVEWHPRAGMTPARQSLSQAEIGENAIRMQGPAIAPPASVLAIPAIKALALAPQVKYVPRPFLVRTLALPDKLAARPWTAVVLKLAHPRVNLVPDHTTALGMESDLLHLMEALRKSSNCRLLDRGSESAPLPARRQDLEYIPTPRFIAPAVPWRPVVHAAKPSQTVEDIAPEARKWPGRRGEMPRSPDPVQGGLVTLGPRVDRLCRLFVRPERRQPALWNTKGNVPPVAPAVVPVSTAIRVPAVLRGFHENGVISHPAYAVRHLHKPAVPGWMVSLLTALVIILISTWVLQKSAFENFSFTHVEAASTSDAAQSAFPTMSKYVEVTGVRATVDSKTSEIRYVVVNHSAADLPPFQVSVKLHPKKGNAVICSFNATIQGMGPNESREMQTTVPRELHSYDLPEWRDMRVEAHVTAK